MKRTHAGRPRLDDGDPSAQICLKLPGKQFDALGREAKIARVSVQDIIRRDLELEKQHRAGKRYPK
jgi:hypothetical protein